MRFFNSKKTPIDDWSALSTFLTSGKLLQSKGEVSPARREGVLFSEDKTNDFLLNISNEIDSILYDGEGATRTLYEIQKEDNGLVWIILEDGNFNDLVSSIYTIGNAISSNGGAENLIAAIFEIYLSVDIDDNSTRRGVRSYCIYRYDRKSFYPFIPTGENEGERDKTAESVLGRDLSNSGLIIEKDFSQWLGLSGIPF